MGRAGNHAEAPSVWMESVSGKVMAMRKLSKGLSAAAAIILFAQGGLQAQEAATPTAEQVVANYVKAVGGRAAVQKITSRVMKGTVDGGAGTLFPLEIMQKAPNKSLSVMEVPDQGKIKQGFDGKTGWQSAPGLGVEDITGTLLTALRRNSQFYRWLRMKELFATLEMVGTSKVGERDAFVMVATPAEGLPEKFYFDTETGLLTKWDYQLETPGGVVSVETFYEDYREVDGIKLPFTLRQNSPDNVLLFKFTEIKHNLPLDDAQFAKPAAP
jgi:zinc protease